MHIRVICAGDFATVPLLMDPAQMLRYLRDCYQADRRGATLWNIFARRTEHRIVMRGREELLNGILPLPYASWRLRRGDCIRSITTAMA